MSKVSSVPRFSETNGEPNVDEKLFRGSEKTFLGGTRGKKEHRKHVQVQAVFGRWGKKTYFRGACWNCDEEHVGFRLQGRKNLLKCRECGETSFMYKGFFHGNNYPTSEYEIPREDEVSGTMYIALVKYKDLQPTLSVLSEESYNDRKNASNYTVELIEKR